jgi:hypothetical protein
MTVTIKSLIKKQQPFAVIQYFLAHKTAKTETVKIYEILLIDYEKNKLKHIEIYPKEFKDFKHLLKQVIDNNYGKIFEFLNFKEHYKLIKKLQKETPCTH